MIQVVRAGTDIFEELWSMIYHDHGLQFPLCQEWNRKYYQAYAEDIQFDDSSFVIVDNKVPIMGLRASVDSMTNGRRELTCYRQPAHYIEKDCFGRLPGRGAQGAFRAELERVISENNINSIDFLDFPASGNLSSMGQYLLSMGASDFPFYTQLIDLSFSEQDLFSQVRKSYKSLINWGKNNLTLRVIDFDTVTLDDIEALRALHVEAAGQETRSRKTWRQQFEMVAHDEAFLVLGESEGVLVSAALFPCSKSYCFYGVSAAKREMFSKPLSHAVVWRAIIHAKKRGCSLFEMGVQYLGEQANNPPSDKEKTIGVFKHGFGGQTRIRMRIKWQQQNTPKVEGKHR